jgi:hypothetical protein
MAEGRSVNVRVAVVDADKFVADLKRIGVAGEAALKQLATKQQVRIDTDEALKKLADLDKKLQGVGVDPTAISDRVRRDRRRFQDSIKIDEREQAGALRSFRDIGSAVSLIEGPLGGAAARFNTLSSVIGRSGVAVGVFAGAIAVGVSALTAMAAAAGSAEERMLRIEAVLRATGNAAGLSARELRAQAEEIGLATGATIEDVERAQAVLATFTRVQEQQFTRTIRVAQDYAAAVGGDVVSRTQQFGKALNDPVRGLESLRDAGISLSPALEKTIKDLARAGQVAEAQRLILDQLEKKYGDTGRAIEQGLNGALRRLGEEWRLTAERGGEAIGILDALTGAVNRYSRVLRDSRENFDNAESARIADLEARIARLKAGQGEDGFLGLIRTSDSAIADFEAQLERLLQRRANRLAKAREDEAAADAGALRAAAADRGQTLESIDQSIEERRLALAVNARERIVEEAEKEIEQLKALRGKPIVGVETRKAPDGSIQTFERVLPQREADENVDAAIAARVRLRDAQLAAIDASAARVKATDREAEALQRLREADAKLIEDMQFELSLIGRSEADIAALTAARRLSAAATDDQRRQVEGLARALEAESNARDDKEALQTLQDEFAALALGNRERAIEAATRRLSADATADQIRAARELAAATYDEAEARDVANEKLREAQREAAGYARSLTDVLRAFGKADLEGAQAAIESTLDQIVDNQIFKPIEEAIFRFLDPAGVDKPKPVYIVSGPSGGGDFFAALGRLGEAGAAKDAAIDRLLDSAIFGAGGRASVAPGDLPGAPQPRGGGFGSGFGGIIGAGLALASSFLLGRSRQRAAQESEKPQTNDLATAQATTRQTASGALEVSAPAEREKKRGGGVLPFLVGGALALFGLSRGGAGGGTSRRSGEPPVPVEVVNAAQGGGPSSPIAGVLDALKGGGRTGETLGADIAKGVASGVKANEGGILGAFQSIAGKAGGLFEGIFAALGNILAAVLHDGGDVGPTTGAPARSVPADVFTGGRARASAALAPDEVPAILQTGERVLNRREAARYRAAEPLIDRMEIFRDAPRFHDGGVVGPRASASIAPGSSPAAAAGGASVSISMTVNTRDAGSFRAAQEHIAADLARAVRQQLASGRA